MLWNVMSNLTLNLWWNVHVKCRFDYVKVVPISRCSTGLRVLFRDDQVVMQSTMITLPTLPTFSSLLLPLLWPQAPFPNYPFLFLITSDLNRHFDATSESLRIEDRASTQPLCSQAIHSLLTGLTVSAHRLSCPARFPLPPRAPHFLAFKPNPPRPLKPRSPLNGYTTYRIHLIN